MTREDWLKWYEERTGSRDLEMSPYEQVLFHPKYGFIVYFKHDDILELHHMCGNGKEWQKVLVEVMRENGLKRLRAFTNRNPKAWQRRYCGHVVGYEIEASLEELEEDVEENGKWEDEQSAVQD